MQMLTLSPVTVTVSDFLCAVTLALALVALITFTLAVKEQKNKDKV